MLTLENITSIDSELPLKELHASFEAGKIYTVLGRTGAGKTELLRTLIGLDPILKGIIRLDGKDLNKTPVRKRQMAMVYQQFINYPHLNVQDNVAFPLLRQKINKTEAISQAHEILKLVGLEGFESRMPSELSGGQQQRVALARAIVKRARILLMDEPLANLDYKLREQLREEFPRLLHNNAESVIIYTTTEPSEAMQLGDEMIVMHEGRIVAQGYPSELFDHPPTIEVARVISDPPISICPGWFVDGVLSFQNGSTLGTRDITGVSNGSIQIGIRPDALSIGGDIQAQVVLAEFSGSDTIVHLKMPFGEAVMLVDGIHEYQTGDTFGVTLDSENLMLFSDEGINMTVKVD